MAKVLKIKNPVLPSREDTFLTARYSSGVALTVKNNEGFANNDFAIVGHPGAEQTESSSVTGTTGNEQIDILAALKFDHAIDSPIFRSDYDQISIERQPSGGSYAEITEGKVNIQWDERDGFTKISVAAGVDTDNYKWRFYNSRSGVYSSYSGILPGTGLTSNHVGFMIKSVRHFGKSPAISSVSDLDILESFNRGQKRIDTLAPDGRWWFSLTEDTDSTRIQSVAGTYKYNLPTGFRAMDVLQVLDVNNQRYALNYCPRTAFDMYKVDELNTGVRDDSIRQWTFLPPDDSNSYGYFGVDPTPKTTGVYFYRRYWRLLPELTSFASVTLVPLPELLVNFALSELFRLKEKYTEADKYENLFAEGVGMLKKLQRRQIGQTELLHWRGQRGFAQMFNSLGFQSLDTMREQYW